MIVDKRETPEQLAQFDKDLTKAMLRSLYKEGKITFEQMQEIEVHCLEKLEKKWYDVKDENTKRKKPTGNKS